MEIQTIVFDLGGVLIDWDPAYLYRKMFDDPKEMDYFLTEVCTPDWNAQQDGGRSWEDAINLLLPDFPQYETEIRAYFGRWTEMLGGPINETVDILREIKEGGQFQLYALTNWSAETFPYALERYDFLQWFAGILVSGAENLKKPDQRIYKLLLERYQIDGSQALFLDDSLANVKGSIEAGLPAIQFHDPTQLRQDLQAKGVL
ncbi:MAG: HAD family phosphatase [Saprospiraceae bacterium]|nr:HAD family phosphatase [Saprospiraceae bacterium]